MNIVGSFALGYLAFSGSFAGTRGEDVRLLVGVGFLGAFTTMSAFAADTLLMLDQGRVGRAALNVLLNPALALAGAALGRAVART